MATHVEPLEQVTFHNSFVEELRGEVAPISVRAKCPVTTIPA
nr:hypothetical protein [Hymenobacter volaticus]